MKWWSSSPWGPQAEAFTRWLRCIPLFSCKHRKLVGQNKVKIYKSQFKNFKFLGQKIGFLSYKSWCQVCFSKKDKPMPFTMLQKAVGMNHHMPVYLLKILKPRYCKMLISFWCHYECKYWSEVIGYPQQTQLNFCFSNCVSCFTFIMAIFHYNMQLYIKKKLAVVV